MSEERPLGARLREDGVEVRVWAPKARRLGLVIDGREVPMQSEGKGYFAARAPGRAGSRYGLRLDGGRPFPDPCSRSQPEGVHALSEVIDPGAFAWTDTAWSSRREPLVALERLVLYELHVGTFTPEGTFAAAAARLEHLRDLGVTAVELMPLHAFPGKFNWGYDPGAYFAVPEVYGSPDDLRRLVDRAHALGLAVFVDVVLNHLGPDGAYVNAYAPMLTPAATPWGSAVNLAEDGVRRFLREAALVWLTEYHADGLRLDATSRLRDRGTPHFLAELTAAAEQLPGPRRLLIAEDLRNHAVVTERRERGGQGLDSQWVDDLASMARHLGGDDQPYYAEYAGASARTLATVLLDGWWMTRHVAHHADTLEASAPAGALVRVTHYLDNHDQAGNRPDGKPFAALCPAPLARALMAALLFAPHIPLLWMGQEWGSTVPFWYFADHGGGLGQSVRRGRQRDHEQWWRPAPPAPDPTAASTAAASRLDWDHARSPEGAAWLALVTRLLDLRSSLPVDAGATWHVEAPDDATLRLERGGYTMLVALRAGASLPDPGGDEEISTEAAPFAVGGQPPVRRDGRLLFAQPSALVLRR